jgi:uncharacterized protein
MSLTMHDLSVPAFHRAMKSLKGVLEKAEAHATAKKIDPNALLLARLSPDMFHTIRQVQTATSMVHWGCALLAGLERPDLPSTEATFADLQARIASTVDFVKGFGPERLNGSETKPVALKFPGRTMEFTGESFLLEFILPNLYFHTAMTYAIMRHNGVEVGKQDFLARG